MAKGNTAPSDASTAGDSLTSSPRSNPSQSDFSMIATNFMADQSAAGHVVVSADATADTSPRGRGRNGGSSAPGEEATHSPSQQQAAFAVTAISNLVSEFQDGERAIDFWNGDVAATEGHLGLMRSKHLEGNPLSYQHLAVSRAAQEGRMDVVQWLHNYTDVPQMSSAMDSAAAGGHLKVWDFFERLVHDGTFHVYNSSIAVQS